jgi:hypothetical protein
MKLFTAVTSSTLTLQFEDRQTNTLRLPDRDNKIAVAQLFHSAAQWARERGARDGQVRAIYKKLNEASYYINGPLGRRRG